MATYNAAAVSDAAIGFERPITLQQGRALRDNPLAIVEGAVNAPKVQRFALEDDGFIQSVTAPTAASWETVTGLAQLKQLGIKGGASVSGVTSSRSVIFQLSNDNGATWGSNQTLIGLVSTNASDFANTAYDAVLDLDTGTFRGLQFVSSRVGGVSETNVNVSAINSTFTIPAGGANAIRFQVSLAMSNNFLLYRVSGRQTF